jgi:adenylate cyclase class IV
MVPPQRNLELKARDPDPPRSLEVCARLGAEDKGLLIQQDTYFPVPNGRLKLRREGDGPAHLIAYERADRTGSRESSFRIVEVPDATGTEAALAAVLGVRGHVSKQRRLFLLEEVRIHLDLVVGLGTYIEFEALAGRSDPARFADRLADLCRYFGLDESHFVAESYCDLLL